MSLGLAFWRTRAALKKANAQIYEQGQMLEQYQRNTSSLVRRVLELEHREAFLVQAMRKYCPKQQEYVTVTTNMDGVVVMVSVQDEDHQVLRVIWERP